MDSKTKTPFQLFFFPKQWCQRRCLSQFVLISVLISFWWSTHNFDFFVINDVGGYCPLDSVQDFSSVFRFFSCFLFPHLCSIVVQVAKISAAQFLPKVKLPRIHFALVSNFLPTLIVFNFIPQNTLINGQDFFFSDYNYIVQHPNFWPARSFFAISALIQFAGSSQFRFELKLRFSENHFPTSVTLPTITLHRHGFEEFGFGLWKLSRHSDMMVLNSEIFSFKLSQNYVMVFNSNNYSLKLSCTCNC